MVSSINRNKNLSDIRPGDKVDIVCQTNEKAVTGEVVSANQSSIVVVLPGHIRLKLFKHKTNNELFVGNQFGMEFHCTIAT